MVVGKKGSAKKLASPNYHQVKVSSNQKSKCFKCLLFYIAHLEKRISRQSHKLKILGSTPRCATSEKLGNHKIIRNNQPRSLRSFHSILLSFRKVNSLISLSQLGFIFENGEMVSQGTLTPQLLVRIQFLEPNKTKE